MGAIRLWPASDRLALGEGLETCLALRVADPGLSVWSAISAGGLAAVALPERVRDVLVSADADDMPAWGVRRKGRPVHPVVIDPEERESNPTSPRRPKARK